MTLSELIQLLRECAGEDDTVDLDGDILDTPLDDLGYDSLSLLQTTSRIEREEGIQLPDDLISPALTPRMLIDQVNALAGQGAVEAETTGK